jgi:shikimate kinase
LVCLGAAASLPAGGGVDPMNRPAVDVACVGPVVSGRGPAHVMVVADNRAIRWEWLSGACRRAVVAGRVPSADAQRIVEAA